MNTNEQIPEQQEGGASDTHHRKEASDVTAAEQLYEEAKKRLLDVNNWEQIAGAGAAAFTLMNDKGEPVQRSPQVGDHFQIDIPGPGSIAGEGYDWVRIEAIDERTENEERYISITVRPATDPRTPGDETGHFFQETATSTFMVQQQGTKVTASVHGRNEKPNTDTENVLDKTRNTLVALGAISMFSKIQWKKLVQGIIEGS